MTTLSPELDDHIFDPAVHATDDQGNPLTNRDGSLRKRRGRKPGQRNGTGTGRSSSASTAAAAGPRKRGASEERRHGEYVEKTSGILQLVSLPLMMTAPVDAVCVAEHTPPISRAVADLAMERPEVAAALDRILSVGPYGALIAAVMPLAVQLAHNHGLLPAQVATTLGATPRDVLELNLVRAAQEQHRAAQEAAAHMAEMRGTPGEVLDDAA